MFVVERDHVPEELAQHQRVLSVDRARRRDVQGVGPEVRHPEVAPQQTAVGVGIGAHAPVAFGGQLGQLGHQPAVPVEQLLGPVALHPALEQGHMFEMGAVDQQRHLVGSERALDRHAVDHLRPRPALGGAQHDHRPARPNAAVSTVAGLGLDLPDGLDGLVEGGGHEPVHGFGVVAFHEMRCPAAPAQILLQLLVLDAGQHGGVADLVAVEVQDRQHRTVGDRIEELGGLPGRRQWAGLGFTVADDAGHDQPGIVKRRPERVTERVPQLAALVDRSRGRRGHMTGDPTRKRELREQPFQASLVLADVRIDLTVGALQVGVADQRRTAMTGPGDIEHVQVVLFDHPVQMHIDEILAGRGAPVPNHHGLHVRQLQRLLQQGVVIEIHLADRQIVGGPPVRIHLLEQLSRNRAGHHRSSSNPSVVADRLPHPPSWRVQA